ncbi:MAG: phosphodiester glycosidase family protein [Clostridiales bacterium]|nr:phosphodiester glycosidase family protein [Clostridiales bacterium]
MKIRWLWIGLLLLLLCPLFAQADVVYEGKTYAEDAEYIDLGDYVVKDFDALTAFLDQMPNLKQVDMWANKMTADQCDMLATRYPGIRWGWTMVIKTWGDEHLVRTDYTAWSTLHNNQSTKHHSEDFAVLKYCWNLLALDVGHNYVTSLDFLYDLPNLRVLILACNAVTDITPIASLKDLEYLEIFNNTITDISPLAELPHLMDLNICFNKIKDLSPLKNITTLQRLWMYSCQKLNTVPKGEAVNEIMEALPNTKIDTTHYSTLGEWRFTDGKQTKRHPHYDVIVRNFGEDHLHPRTQYVPFEDSWPLDGSEKKEDLSQAQQPEQIELVEQVEQMEMLTPQDFSDKGYLLPVDFSGGSEPNPDGYKDENTYEDSTISVAVHQGNTGTCLYWYADIRLKDASQLRTMAATADGSFDTNAEMNGITMADNADAVVAINGDFYKSAEKKGLGYIIRQGILYNNSLSDSSAPDSRLMDVLLIDEDGDLIGLKKPLNGTIPEKFNGKRILNAFSFGPILVDNGAVVQDYKDADRWLDMARDAMRQRMCICQVDHLHYLVLCCAGPYRGNTGMTLREFADLAASLGVRIAYNLDGGDSTLLYFDGRRINEFGSTSSRRLQDIIYFASAE